MRKLTIICFIILVTGVSVAQVSKTGTTVAAFLNIEAGARPLGMGGAYVSVAEGVSSMYWNPAGIARAPEKAASFCNSNWIADITYSFAGVVVPMQNFGSIGINATFLSMDDMQITTIDEPEGVENGYFSAGSYALGVSFARTLTDRFSIGFTGKYINEHIYNSSASAMALDLGTLFTTPFSGLTIGMSISNFGTKMRMQGKDLLVQHDTDETITGNNPFINANLATDPFDLPLMFRVGVSLDVLKGIGNSNLCLSVDALHPTNNYESVSVGGEYVFNSIFMLRGGYNTMFLEDDQSGLSLGAGVKYRIYGTQLAFDYGYRDFGVLKDIQMFSIGIGF